MTDIKLPEPVAFAAVCEMLPADTNWGEPLTPAIAREIVQAAIAAERESNSPITDATYLGLAEDIARLTAEVEALRAVIRTALNRNGGPIDRCDTVDRVDYVMVRRDDFDDMCEAVGAARSGEAT